MDIDLISINKSSPVSIAQQIANCILVNLEKKNIRQGDKLPTERELSESLGVARGTVKNAYKKLENMQIIQTRQGSGSFIAGGNTQVESIRKNNINTMVEKTIMRLKTIGLSDDEIRHLVNMNLSHSAKNGLNAAIVYDNAEFLINFKKQLSGLKNITFSIFIMESITEDINPEKLLAGYDLIIVPTKLFTKALNAMPRFKDKIIEAAVSPSNETIISITALPRTSRVGIICRTNAFLEAVKQSLLSFGFLEENISSFFEMNYTTQTYFPGGIDALISFSDAHIFTDMSFEFRNREFLKKGGKIIVFEYNIDRGSLIYLESRIGNLLGNAE